MKKIRQGVFETNSSSTHSLSLRSSRDYENFSIPEEISFGEFGWGYDVLKSPEEKLSYVLTFIGHLERFYDIKDLKSANSKFEEVKYIKWLKEVVKEKTGESFDIVLIDSEYYPFGYIDHQSLEPSIFEEEGFWSEDGVEFKNKMKDLIFNEKYSIIIDNDNH